MLTVQILVYYIRLLASFQLPERNIGLSDVTGEVSLEQKRQFSVDEVTA